ncbi:unnamed protein product [Clonostachys chloroleuca]|uniref:Beta-lactamase-related domain-containing protein n=1 Tax=Clonostachys chloroleuca TaxID=1926264 RepID=A0AA35LTY9_9HYPO|nr:unnamed protein product [Clonostachys chloroleuca]
MLASHVAGVPRDSNPFDLYVSGGEGLEDAGFPKPDSADIPGCDVPGGQSCTKEDLLNMLVSEPLVWQAGDRAAYSSLSFILLGYALENITGKAFIDLLKESVLKPLDLSFTGLDPPVDLSQAIIPAGQGGFVMGYDIGNYTTTAGLYSTPGDISKFLRAIMANTLVSPLQTRQWLKPSIFAGSISTAVGMPWEIFRLSNLTPDSRPIDLYTKSGGIFGYETNMVLIPEFNVGISVLAAGDDASDALMGLLDIVIPATVSSLNQLARQQAKETYADDGPGLRITQWTNRGKSMLEFLASREGTNVMDLDMRLYPVGEGQRWRLVLERTEGANPSVFSDACITWLRVDQMRYAKQPVDEFTFDIKGGAVIGLKNSGLRAKLVKTS